MRFGTTGLIILCISLIFIGWLYNYPTLLHLLPQGSHIWRQADCVAMAQNYQQYNLSFFQPQIYNLQADYGKAAGEFPILYYIAAQFTDVAFALRFIHTLIFAAGIIGVYFVALFFLQRQFLTLIACWIFCSSPLIVFYGNNFLSDAPALSFAILGWAFLLYGYKKQNFILSVFAFSCFTIAGLLKASEVLNFGFAFLFHLKFGRKNIKYFSLFILLLIPMAWYGYARQYNVLHHDKYYFLSIAPIWKLSLYNIGLGAWRMLFAQSNNYFWWPMRLLLLCSLYFVFKHHKKLDAELRFMLYASGLFTILYVLIFYEKMILHEYYYIYFYIFILFTIISILKTYNFYYAENVFSHAFIFLLIFPNLIFCKNFIAKKLTDSQYNHTLATSSFQTYLSNNNVSNTAVVLSLPDDTPNKTLYLIKRKGYTEFNPYISLLEKHKINFILIGDDALKKEVALQPFLQDSLSYFKGFTLYKASY